MKLKELESKLKNCEVIGDSVLIKGDCLAVMDKLIDNNVKVDAIITDIPYGTTNCKWDSVIPFNKYITLPKTNKSKKLVPFYRDDYILRELKNGREYNEICNYFDNNSKEGMWDKLNKLIKPNGAVVLFGSEPFSSALRMSNIKNYKYDWVWNKLQGSGFLNSKKRPLTSHEDILIFATTKLGNHTYKPQLENKEISKIRPNGIRKKQEACTYGRHSRQFSKGYDNTKSYPTDIINQSSKQKECNSVNRVHPTQKPISLIEYLIKTYTNEGELILDFTSGSFTTSVASIRTNRKSIGIELDESYYNIGVNRVKEELNKIKEDL